MRGDRLKYLREQNGLTQLELAEALNMSESQILRYEKGNSEARSGIVIDISRFFGITSDYLLGLSDDPKSYGEFHLTPREVAIIEALRQSNFLNFTALLHEDLRSRD